MNQNIHNCWNCRHHHTYGDDGCVCAHPESTRSNIDFTQWHDVWHLDDGPNGCPYWNESDEEIARYLRDLQEIYRRQTSAEKTRQLEMLQTTMLQASKYYKALHPWLASELEIFSEEELADYPELQQWKEHYDRTH